MGLLYSPYGTGSAKPRSPAAIAKRLRAIAGRMEKLLLPNEIDEKLTRALAQELRDEALRLERR